MIDVACAASPNAKALRVLDAFAGLQSGGLRDGFVCFADPTHDPRATHADARIAL